VELINHIASIDLFKDLPVKHLNDLAMILTDQVFEKGQLIFSEGDEATGFYVIITGRVKIFKLSTEGKEQILHIFGPKEPIGEVAVFEGKRFPANAESLEESRLFFFPGNAFMELIKENPSIALHMLAVLSRRLRRFAALIDDLSLKEVPGRLAAYLLYLSEIHQGVDDLSLDISKGQLSSLLGTIPETLSRILTKMSNSGLLRSEGPRGIQILDRKSLQDLASGETRLH
jgi:CRP/FNR family transcriptional regulator